MDTDLAKSVREFCNAVQALTLAKKCDLLHEESQAHVFPTQFHNNW